MEDWCGFEERDEKTGKYGYWENPHTKWDWYQIGGRWNGFFRLKKLLALPPDLSQNLEGVGLTFNELYVLANLKKENSDKFDSVIRKFKGKKEQIETLINQITNNYLETFRPGELGEPSLLCLHDENYTPPNKGYADQARKGDIDFEYMIEEAGIKARDQYLLVQDFFGGEIPKIRPWKEFLENEKDSLGIEECRKLYHDQDAIRKLHSDLLKDHPRKEELNWIDLEDFQMSEEEYVAEAKQRALITFAVLMDGKWYERGKMGWWATVSDEKDLMMWEQEFNKLLDTIPDDTLLTIVDCHI